MTGARIDSIRTEVADEGLAVAVAVANVSDRPVFVTCDLRRLQVADDGQSCTLWFSDAGRDLTTREPGLRHHALPMTETIEPGEYRDLRTVLPRILNRLVVDDDGSWDVERRDLSAIRQIEVRVTVAAAPFYFNPNGPTVLAQLDLWGEVIAGELAVADGSAS